MGESAACTEAFKAVNPIFTGNPVHIGIGNKFQKETDYQGEEAFSLRFVRYYNAQDENNYVVPMGKKWRHNFRRAIITLSPTEVIVERPDGKRFVWTDSGSGFAHPAVPEASLVKTAGGWTYTADQDVEETYGSDGQLLTIVDKAGHTTTLDYQGGKLVTVTGPFGRTLTFTYSIGRIATVTEPNGGKFRYSYDSEHGNLISVSYPDNTPLDDTDNPTRTYHYEDTNFPHHLTGITEENGNRYATWSYDAQGRAISSEHAGGVDNYSLTYNADGTTTVTDPLGQARTYSFTTQHGVIKVASVTGGACAQCGGDAASYSYDANGFLASKTDHNGNVTHYVYNTRGLQESRTEAVGTPEARTITTQWHADFRQPTLITEPGKTTAYTHNTNGQVLTRTVTDTATSKARTTTYTYFPNGLLETVDGPRDNATDVADVTHHTYDAQGNRTHSTNALSQVTQITDHDGAGRPLRLLDANNIETLLTYDPRGRLLTRTTAGAITGFTYDDAGNLTRITQANGTFLDYTYDAAQRLTDVTDGLGNRIHYVLDNHGNRTGEQTYDSSNTLKRSRTQVYNTLSQLINVIGAGAQTTLYVYDDNGNRTAITDPLNRETVNAFDALDRLIQVTDPVNGLTGYGYNALDQLTSVTDPEGLITAYTYNAFGDVLTQTSPDTGATVFTYDPAGNRLTQTDARGVITTYRYDALNRLTQIQYPDTSLNVALTYDQGTNGIGRLTGMTDASGQTSYSYDAQGNLIQVQTQIGTESYTLGYGHDLAGNRTRITYPSGRTVDYTYDAANRISQVTATQGGQTQTLADNLTYLPFGPLTALTYGNGLTRTLSFDQDYQLTQLTDGASLDRGYGYDLTGNIETLTDGILGAQHDQGFSYDDLDRLIQATGGYGQLDYGYDGVGNRLTLTRDQSGQTTSDTYSYVANSHRLDAIAGDNPTTFQYDANGNTTAAHGHTYSYNDRSRLIQAITPSQILGYVYNGQGERVEKREGTSTTQYLYDSNGQLLVEHQVEAQQRREVAYLNGQRLAMWRIDDSQTGNEPTPLISGQAANDSVVQDAWDYYQITAAATDVQLDVTLSDLTADADLYVRAGAQPDAATYDCRPVLRGNTTETCSLTNTGITTWHIAVHGYEAASYTLTATLGQSVPDTSPPTVPQNLSGTAQNPTQVDLTWTASTDTGGGSVAGYHLYRDGGGTPIATVTGTGYSDSGLTANTSYSYQVTAFDNANPANESAAASTSVTTPAASTTATYITTGSSWRYRDDGSDQGTAWRALTFDDSSWSSGTAELGYGDGDEATVVSYGSDENNKHVTTYFRQSFNVTSPAQVTSLALDLLRDDGAVVYLNGTEVVRSNMPAGTIAYTTLATEAIGSPEEATFYPYSIDPGLLVTGSNVLAVEVHQGSPDSSDLSFDVSLWTGGSPPGGGGPTALTSGQAVNGNVALNEWHYYQIETTANDIQIDVVLNNLSTDADLYVRAGAQPDENTYDCRPYEGGTTLESCSLTNTGATTWFIGVYGYEASSYTLTATLSQGGGGGPTPLTSGQSVNGAVALDEWHYYQIDAAVTDTQLDVLLNNLSVDADLYVRAGSLPDADDYDCRPYVDGSDGEACSEVNSGATTWYIGIHGYAASNYTVTATLTGP